MSVRVLEEPKSRPVPVPSDVAVGAAVCGAGLTGSLLGSLSEGWDVRFIVDHDQTGVGQVVLPAFAVVGEPKAAATCNYRRRRCLAPSDNELAVVAEAQALGGGAWRSLGQSGAVIVAATDDPTTQRWLAQTVKQYAPGAHFVATGLGPHHADVIAVSAGSPGGCFACAGRGLTSRPSSCLARDAEAAAMNQAPAPPTGSSLHIAAAAVAVVIEEATAMVAGQRNGSVWISVAPGSETIRAAIPRDASCPVCADKETVAADLVTLDDVGFRHELSRVSERLGSGEWELQTAGSACRFAECSDCDGHWRARGYEFLRLGRRSVCGRCGSQRILASHLVSAESWVPLGQVAHLSPARLGYGWWPILHLRRSVDPRAQNGGSVHDGYLHVDVELAADSRDAGPLVIEPMTVEVL